MSCPTKNYEMILNFGAQLEKFLEDFEAMRCKTCESIENWAEFLDDYDVPPGLGDVYRNWIGETADMEWGGDNA
ncbi:hypothetical protein SEA_LIFES_53 [Microbacterium phage Lifes]|nr:hypothetical protein SEA_LIFES_53 [Microbacterium phage Lifes]